MKNKKPNIQYHWPRMRIQLLLSLMLFVLGVLYSAKLLAHQVINSSFVLTIPDRFKPFPDAAVWPNILHAFIDGDPQDDIPDTIFFVERLAGTIDRTPLTRADLPSNPNLSLYDATWKSFTVQVAAIRETLNGTEYITQNVHVPTLPTALQLKLIGPYAKNEELKTELQDILNSLEANSNWLTDNERTQKFLEGIGRLSFFLIIIVGIVLYVVRRRRKRQNQAH